MTTGTVIRSIEGDTVDKVCHRVFGRTAGVTEQVLALNPGLAGKGPVLPNGTPITLPEHVATPTKKTLSLWD